MRLIDADALQKELFDRKNNAREWYEASKAKDDEECMVRADSAIAAFIECILTLKNAKTVDAVEVVRCKNCLMHQVCRFELGLGMDGFCSQGDRN